MDWLLRNTQSTDITRVMSIADHLYRITPDDFSDYFQTTFGVHLVYLHHRFVTPLDRIGADLAFPTFGDPPDISSGHVVSRLGPVTLIRGSDFLVFRYVSLSQEFHVAFETSSERSLVKFSSICGAHLSTFTFIFEYLVNRVRAEEGIRKSLEDDNQFVSRLVHVLHKGSGDTSRLQELAVKAGFSGALCALYSPLTKSFCGILASHDFFLENRQVLPFVTGGFVEELIDPGAVQKFFVTSTAESEFLMGLCGDVTATIYGQPFGAVSIPSSVARSDVSSSLSEKLASHERGLPRGVLLFYRGGAEDQLKVTEASFVDRCSREFAAWIDELDEKAEVDTVSAILSACRQFCEFALDDAAQHSRLGVVLSQCGTHLTEAAKVYIDADGDPRRIDTGYLTDSEHFGYVPLVIQELDFKLVQEGRPYRIDSNDPEACSVLVGDGSSKGPFLVVTGPLPWIAAIRKQVYEIARDAISLASHFKSVDNRRVSWIQRTVHEIRHPLQGLLTIVEDARWMAGSQRYSKRDIVNELEDSETTIKRIATILEGFSSFAGIASLSPNHEPTFIFDDVLRPMIRVLDGFATRKGIKLSAPRGYMDIPRIRIDQNLLSVIFYNLLDNAIKYGHEGSEVQIGCLANGKDYVLEVSNAGSEIAADEQDNIFKSGRRGRNVPKDAPGIGVGLHTALAIAKKMGCRVELRSRGAEGGRVVFAVCIPASEYPAYDLR